MFQVDLPPSDPGRLPEAALDNGNLNKITFHRNSNQDTLSGSRYCFGYKRRREKVGPLPKKVANVTPGENGSDNGQFFDLKPRCPERSYISPGTWRGTKRMSRLNRQAV
jgi:hypothetical protein